MIRSTIMQRSCYVLVKEFQSDNNCSEAAMFVDSNNNLVFFPFIWDRGIAFGTTLFVSAISFSQLRHRTNIAQQYL